MFIITTLLQGGKTRAKTCTFLGLSSDKDNPQVQ